MPVKVTATTNSAAGTITRTDLEKMKTDFQDDVTLVPMNQRVSVIKKLAWYITKKEIDQLFLLNKNSDKEASILEINFAIHLDEPDLCTGASLKDKLTVVLQAKTDEHETVDSNNESVIVPGYNTFTALAITIKNLNNKDCCPSSKG